MRIHEVDSRSEQQVLASLVFNNHVLAHAANKIEEQCFKSGFAHRIAARCATHYKKYKTAPKQEIRNYIEQRASSSKNKEEIQALESLWSNIEDMQKQVSGKKANNQLLIDRLNALFQQNRLKFTIEVAQSALDDRDLSTAHEQITKYRDYSLNDGQTPFIDRTNPQTIQSKLSVRADCLLEFQGAIGRFFGKQLARDNFIAFQGPDKSFKSFWLQELEYRALKERLRVMFVGIGDMDDKQYIQRLVSRVAGRPFSKQKYKYPVGWKSKQSVGGSRIYRIPKLEERSGKEIITPQKACRIMERFAENFLRTKDTSKYSKALVDFSITIDQIESRIQELQDLEKWSPDVLIIDYADRLDPPKHIRDKIEQIDYNWKAMRRIALDYHCLVLTATQVRRSGYKGKLQTRDDAADNKNKNAHVTGMIGINAMLEEERNYARTLNWIVLREHTMRSVVYTAGCPAIANPCVLSC